MWRAINAAGIIAAMGSSNERRRCNVTSFLIGWAHTQNDHYAVGRNEVAFVIGMIYSFLPE